MLNNIKKFLVSLPTTSGVYQMYNDKHQLLYIGKAKNLKQRLTSYFRPLFVQKTKLFMAQVSKIEIILTPNENSALLLESNLIKTHKPRYNVLFKDDKSFPYLLLSEHVFPRLTIYRGALHKVRGRFFGPFPDGSAVGFILNLLQRIFRLRVCQDSCMPVENKILKHQDNINHTLHKMNSGAKPIVNEDREQRRRQSINSFYAGYRYRRSRPCMLYQIKLCCAPCVGYVEQQTYMSQVDLATRFLRQHDNKIVDNLTQLMEQAAAQKSYEQAAEYRDQIASIHKIQTMQTITTAKGNIDIIAMCSAKKEICINVLCVRRGLMIGTKNYFSTMSIMPVTEGDILQSFVLHYYEQQSVVTSLPDKILVKVSLPEIEYITEILKQKFGRRILLSRCTNGKQKQLMSIAKTNALHALTIRQYSQSSYKEGLLDFVRCLNLSTLPQRIECFDVSHNVGEAQVVSCVVFDEQGPSYHSYRRFNVHTKSVGDDYDALREALWRRYRSSKIVPDVIMLDGGVGQLHVANEVCRKLRLSKVLLIAIAKGKASKPGLEKIYLVGNNKPLILKSHSAALHFIQRIRDAAHNFALTGHKKQMTHARCKSGLEDIPGIGKDKRKALLQYFGGIRELKAAGIDDLVRVQGVGQGLARIIYEYLHA